MTLRRVVAAAATGAATALLGAAPAVAVTPTGFWTPVSPPFSAASPSAAVLPGGKVLLAGGASSTTDVHESSEIYDPGSDAWSAPVSTQAKRVDATAVTLPNGKVLVVGGESALDTSAAALDSAEVYDPGTNTWTNAVNTMSSPRANKPIVVVLRSGKVLVAGGSDATGAPVNTADIYDPPNNGFSPTNGTMGTARDLAAAALLPSGKVLVAGGTGPSNAMLNSAEVFDPGTLTWSPVANTMFDPRGLGPGAVALRDGQVLVMGGVATLTPSAVTSATSDLYNPATNTFSQAASMQVSRANFAYAPLADGRVLVAGGLVAPFVGPKLVTTDAEVYDPSTNAWQAAGSLPVGVGAAASVALPSGQVLVMGGAPDPNSNATVRQAALYTPYAAPTKPLAVSATAGVTSAFVTFAPPASNGGLPIVNYTIVASTGQRATLAGDRTAVTMTGLASGRPLTFTVIANNAVGAGAASTASNQVTPAAAPASHKPPPTPKLTIGKLKTKVKLTAFFKGVAFTVTPNRSVALQISLIGAVTRATIARAFNLTLASKRLGVSARMRTVTLKPSKRLVGRPRSATVQLVIVATDAAGARTTTTRTIHVSR